MRTPAALLLALVATVGCSAAATTEPGDGVKQKDPTEDTGPAQPEEDTAPPSDDTGAPSTDTGTKPPPPPLCAEATSVMTATPAAHDVLFLLDRSGSMHSKVASGTTRWLAAQKALSSLLDVIGSTSVRAGLDVFPRGDKPITCCWIDPKTNYTDCSCKTGELPTPAARCAATSYAPAIVPVATLGDAQKAAIRSGIKAFDGDFYWGTPMKAGLQGAIAKQASLDLDGVRSVVLITDGEPTSCNATDDKIDSVVAVADAGTKLVKPVTTYVVGVVDGSLAANAANLSKLAVAGGTKRADGCEKTNSCFYAVDAKSFETDISKAFADIEMKAFSCTFDVPMPSGGIPDYDLMNVTLKGTDGKVVTLAHDATKTNGWELTAGKTKVQLYGAACTAVKAEPKTEVQVVVGCKTVEAAK